MSVLAGRFQNGSEDKPNFSLTLQMSGNFLSKGDASFQLAAQYEGYDHSCSKHSKRPTSMSMEGAKGAGFCEHLSHHVVKCEE